MMTIKTLRALRIFGVSMAAGALLIAVSPVAPGNHKAALDLTDHTVTAASAISPSTFHHWPDAVLAGLNPSTFHHWPNRAVAEIDPETFHHWGITTTAMDDLDPETFHHWG